MQGYFKGTLVGLVGCAITSIIGSTTLVGTTWTTTFFFVMTL
jgi:hypothetical protein